MADTTKPPGSVYRLSLDTQISYCLQGNFWLSWLFSQALTANQTKQKPRGRGTIPILKRKVSISVPVEHTQLLHQNIRGSEDRRLLTGNLKIRLLGHDIDDSPAIFVHEDLMAYTGMFHQAIHGLVQTLASFMHFSGHH